MLREMNSDLEAARKDEQYADRNDSTMLKYYLNTPSSASRRATESTCFQDGRNFKVLIFKNEKSSSSRKILAS